MRQHTKTLLAATAMMMAGSFSAAHADSVAQPRPLEVNTSKVQSVSNVGVKSASVDSPIEYYNYPDPADVRHTGILFFYTEKVLAAYFDNDPQKLYDFIDTSIAVNNQALRVNGIGLERHAVGVLPMDPAFVDADMYNRDGAVVNYFTETATGSMSSNAMAEKFGQYGASYYVLLAHRDLPDGVDATSTWVGKGKLGGDAAIVTPYDNIDHAITVMAHELGHNDGLRHNVSTGVVDDMLTDYAFGDSCNGNHSMMDATGFSYTGEYFFSDPQHTDKATGEPCGEMDVADAAASYREGLLLVDAKRQEAEESGSEDFTWPFRTVVDMNAPTGVATLDVENAFVNESTGELTGSVIWSGLDADGDSLAHGSFELVVDYEASTVTPDDLLDDGIVTLVYDGRNRSAFSIALADDSTLETDETLVLNVKNPNGVTMGNASTQITYTISSDDTGNPGTFGFADSAVSVNEGQSVNVTLARTGGSDGEIVLQVRSQNGTATAGVDYTAVDMQITFAPGETEKQITLETMTDTDQDDAQFTLEITNTDVAVDSATVTVTINDTTEDNSGGNNGGNNGGGNGSTGGSGGGGSVGGGLLLLAGVALWRRRARR